MPLDAAIQLGSLVDLAHERGTVDGVGDHALTGCEAPAACTHVPEGDGKGHNVLKIFQITVDQRLAGPGRGKGNAEVLCLASALKPLSPMGPADPSAVTQ
jgi:hypothetical protein